MPLLTKKNAVFGLCLVLVVGAVAMYVIASYLAGSGGKLNKLRVIYFFKYNNGENENIKFY